MRIVLRSRFLDAPLAALAARHGAETVVADDAAAMRSAVGDADALWLWPHFYDADLLAALERAPRLRWLQLVTMGYDPIEEHGAPAHVTVTNAGDAYAPTVAEHAVASLLALVRRIPAALERARTQTWAQAEIGPRVGTLNGSTVAVLGFGNIGRAVAERLRGFDVRVVAVTRTGAPHPLADECAAESALHEVLRRSDAVVVAVPLTARTRGMLNADALAALPPHAVVVNVARGPVIDQRALADALANGTLGGAALDVVNPEPLPENDPLWSAPNVLITPHVAGFGGDVAARRILALVERNLALFAAGRPLEAQVPVGAHAAS